MEPAFAQSTPSHAPLPVMQATQSIASNDAGCGPNEARLSTNAVNCFELF